jgi:hypothetical protein
MSCTRVAELAVAQAGNGVVFVKALLRLGGGLDVPFDQRRAAPCDSWASTVLPVPGSPLTSSGRSQHGGVDRHLQSSVAT